ncbi:hypothetical protein [Actinomadura sp. 9N407]|uniref:hypothetical protein n=1 Tax=Actinomadura sp. 9N407 TaxID=3375154 RepID=UPI0037A34413
MTGQTKRARWPREAARPRYPVVGGYVVEPSPAGVWFLVDPDPNRAREIVGTFFKDGPGLWRGKGPRGLVLVKPIDDDTEDPHLVMAERLVADY